MASRDSASLIRRVLFPSYVLLDLRAPYAMIANLFRRTRQLSAADWAPLSRQHRQAHVIVEACGMATYPAPSRRHLGLEGSLGGSLTPMRAALQSAFAGPLETLVFEGSKHSTDDALLSFLPLRAGNYCCDLILPASPRMHLFHAWRHPSWKGDQRRPKREKWRPGCVS